MVLTDSTSPEKLKDLLISADSTFILSSPVNKPLATYKVLWYTPPSRAPCRVDIFIPGIISLPFVPQERITASSSSDLPAIPLLACLLHKVLAWIAHGKSSKQHVREKQSNDTRDITELLEIAVEASYSVLDEIWMPEWFITDATNGATAYVQKVPESASDWKKIGLKII